MDYKKFSQVARRHTGSRPVGPLTIAMLLQIQCGQDNLQIRSFIEKKCCLTIDFSTPFYYTKGT